MQGWSLVRIIPIKRTGARRSRAPAGNAGGLVIHSAAGGHGGAGFFFFGYVGDQTFGGQDHGGDGGGIFEGAAHDLERVNHAGLEHVTIFFGDDVVAEVLVALFLGKSADVLDDDCAILAGILSQFADGGFKSLADNGDADGFIFAIHFDLVESGHSVDEDDFTTGDDAFFNGGTCGREGIFDAVLLLFEFGLGGCANTDDGNAAGELGQTLLQFFLVVIAGALVDLNTDLLDAALDLGGITLATNDGGVVLVGDDFLSLAEVVAGWWFRACGRSLRR